MEDRTLLSAISWNTTVAPTGGDWDTAADWVGGVLPTSADTVTINLTGSGTVTHATNVSDSVLSLTTNSNTALTLNSGTLIVGSGTSEIDGTINVGVSGTLGLAATPLVGAGSLTVAGHFNPGQGATLGLPTTTLTSTSALNVGNFTVSPGATLAIGSNVGVQVGPPPNDSSPATLTDNGILTFASGDTVTLNDNGYYYGTQIVVGSGGLLNATSTVFNASNGNSTNGNNYTQIVVNSGGHLQASGSTFAIGQVYLADGVVFNAGDLVGNGFDSPLYIPAIDVQYLSGTGNNNLRFQTIDIQPDTIVNGQTLALNAIGTQTTVNLRYVFPSGLTVNQGGNVTVAANVPVQFAGNMTVNTGATVSVGANVAVTVGPPPNNSAPATLADNGVLSFASGDVVTLNDNGYYYGTQIVVGSGGLLNASTMAFNESNGNSTNGNNYTQIVVNSGGHLQASGSTFAIGQVYLADGVVFNAGDLVGNGFDSPLYIPAIDVQYLSGTGNNNLRFQGIYLQSDTLANGQSVTLNSIGTQTSTNLKYFIPGGFTINQGATLAVGANVVVQVGPPPNNSAPATLADNGVLSFASGDVVTLNDNGYYYGTQIVVGSGGLLNASTMAFNESNGNNTNGNNYTQIVVNSGGHLQASGSTFAIGQVYLADGVVFNAGDLVGNGFDSPLYIPAIDVQYLSGTGNNNLRFQGIYLQSDTLANGQSVTLNSIGTQTSTNLKYFIPGGFTINQGATLAVGANVVVQVGPPPNNSAPATLADNGVLSFASGDVVTLNDNGYYYGTQIVVGSGGLLNASTMAFNESNGNNTNGNNYTQIVVNSGGHLQASGSTFAIGQVYLADGVVFNAGDLVGNGFDSPLYIPAIDVQYLSGTGNNNLRFQGIYLQSDTLANGQSVTLNSIGTQTSTNLKYFIPGGFTINQGATLAVGANVVVQVGPPPNDSSPATLADNGVLSFASGDVVTLNDNGYYYGTQIVVGSGGLLNGTSTVFSASNGNSTNGNNYTQIVVNSGGQFAAGGGTLSVGSVTLNSATIDTITSDVVATTLTVNSGATNNIHGNDFSNIAAQGIVAVGDPSATIDLTANFWGTSNASQIQAKILDHNANPTTRPTVNFGSSLANSPATIVGVVYNDLNGNGVQDGTEPGLGGVVVYLDVNNSGTLASNDPSTVTNASGQFQFNGLTPGTYVVREVAPGGTVETAPSLSAVATTIDFDGTGGESGITGAGVSKFSYHGASFSGGTIFAPSAGQSALLASGTLAYNASATAGEVDFSQPVSSATFFYVHGFGFGSTGDLATAYAADGSVVATVSSNAATTSGDPANFVTLTGSKPIARITFVGGVVDNFTFTTAANNPANLVLLAAGQTSSTVSFGNEYVPAALEVQSLTPTSTGFSVTFNAPVNTSVLNLYDAGGVYGAADATLVGASTGPVTGSLVVSPNGETVTFIRTAGLLIPDTYTLTLTSGPNAFESTTGSLLDGIGNGTPGSNLVSTFTVNPLASNAVVVSVPNFTRGYGQTVNVPASSSAGLPITLSTGLNVSSVDLTLDYNPALLTLTSFTTTIPGAMATANLSTPGVAIITISSATQFSASSGPIILGSFTASVPNTAPYGSKEILDLRNLSVFDDSVVPQPLPAVGQDGIHVAAYLADINGDGNYTTQDVTLEQREIGLINSGFGFYKMTDPVLLGDATGDGQLESNDTTLLQRVIGQISVPNIPALPTGLTPPPSGGPDPTLFIPSVSGEPGDVVTVPVRVTVTEADGISVSSYQVAISYDPTKFTVSSVGTVGAEFAALGAPVITFPAAGEIIVQGTSGQGTGTIPFGTTADLFDLSFTVNAGASNGPSTINLLQNIKSTATAIFGNDANLTQLTLSPAPTNGATDSVDGTFQIGAAPATTLASSVTTTFSTAAQNLTLNATVTSDGTPVNEGTETFSIFNGMTQIGSSVTVDVSAGAASTPYTLPAATPGGVYTIQAVYDGTANYLTSTDASQTLVVSAAASATASASASANFNGSAQNVSLSATITSAAGTVNEGTETFTLLTALQQSGFETPSVGSGSYQYNPTGSAWVFANGAGIAANGSGFTSGNPSAPGGTQVAFLQQEGSFSQSLWLNSGTYSLSFQAAQRANLANNSQTFQVLVDGTPVGTFTPSGSSYASYSSDNFTVSTGSHDITFAGLNPGGGDNTAFVDQVQLNTISGGGSVIGTAVSGNVVNGTATANYSLPAGLPGGTYIVQAVYGGTSNFLTSTDSSHSLTVGAVVTGLWQGTSTQTAGNAVFNFTMNLTQSQGSVSGTSTIQNQSQPQYYGTMNLTGSTSQSTFTFQETSIASQNLPPGYDWLLVSGPLQVLGDQSAMAGTWSGGAINLTRVLGYTTTVAASSTAVTFNTAAQTVPLGATLTSPGGTVSEGTVTFTLFNGSTQVGPPVVANVIAGAAGATYSLPAGTPTGTYTIQAAYSGTADFSATSDSTHVLTVSAAASATATASASATFNVGALTVPLSATITSPAGTVNEGTETFTILNGTTVVGTPITVNVAAGAAATVYALPPGTPAGTYIIQAEYNGTTNFQPFTDRSQTLVVSAAASATASASASVTFNGSSQTVPLSATITSVVGIVNEGTETFTIFNGSTPIGTPVTVDVSAGAAAAVYSLPAGTPGGTYIIQAEYNGTTNFQPFTDRSQTLVVSAAASATASASASVTFNGSSQTVPLSATITSVVGIVNEGTETFTIFNGSTPIGTPVTVDVSAGAAAAVYSLPAGTPGGTYIIQAEYNGTTNFQPFTDRSQTLVVSAAASATASASASVTFNGSSQTVPLSATITSVVGIVNEGTETFTIFNGSTPIGTPVTVDVSAGAAAAVYSLPAGTPGGTYIIQAEYNGTTNFQPFTDRSQTLVVSAAASATASASASVTFNGSSQTVPLSATITSVVGIVNEGTETFTIFNGSTPIGTPVTVDVSAGAAAAVYSLPAGTPGGTYIIQAEYNGTTNFQPFTDRSQTLVVSAAASATASASASVTFNGSSQTVPLSATITSVVGIVNEGTETFTIFNGSTPIGSPVTVDVSAGAAAAVYSLPAGTPGGTYIIQAEYNGTTNFQPFTDRSQTLVVSAAASATASASASVTFNGSAQTVPLSATITSVVGIVNEGTETFTIFNGSTPIGSPVTVDVSAGAAAAVYSLPAGTPGGTYIIQAEYNGTTNFQPFTDRSQTLVVSAAASATASASASVTFNGSAQTVPLSATITSVVGIVNEGTETFTIFNGSTPIGTPVTVDVSAGAAAAVYSLPAGTPAGIYIIKAEYNGTTDFLGDTDDTQNLLVSASAAATASVNASVTYNGAEQDVPLSATVTSGVGIVNEGTETFTIFNGMTPVGSPVMVDVSAGAAAAVYVLPAGTPGGTYIIQAMYNGTTNFGASTDTTHSLIVSAAASATAAANASVTFNAASQNVSLSATITSGAGVVNEGTETFTILNGMTPVGSPVMVDVSAGAAAAVYSLPAGTSGGTYTIQAVYSGTPSFQPFTDAAHSLIVSAAATATAAANASVTFNAASQNVPLSATITSGAGVVNEGTETFTILNGMTPVGSPVMVDVSAGAAAAVYSLPAGTPGGTYTIQAAYNGTPNFGPTTDAGHTLTVSAAATATAAANASVPFNTASQNVPLSATVTSGAGIVNEGTETFTILNGMTPVGSPVMVDVSAGAAAAAYSLPAGTPVGTYTIQAAYSGTPNFSPTTDAAHTLTVTAAATATAAANASVPFNSAAQNVPLSATVTSGGNPVGEGTETFTILNGMTPIGSPVMVDVSAGAASAIYVLPAGTPVAVYTIQAAYSGTPNFSPTTDAAHTLTVTAAATATAAANASVPFNTASQNVPLSATVTSGGNPVGEGTETFTILNGMTPIGSPVMVDVSAGAASAIYVLPAGTPAASYTIQAAYSGTPNFSPATDAAHTLTVTAAATATAAANASVPFNSAAQNVPLSATVTSGGNPVGEGTETFTILNGMTPVGSPVTVAVNAGAAAAVYVLPAGTPAASYTIQAAYSGTPNFAPASDNTHHLVVTQTAVTVNAVSVQWGSESAALVTNADGLRLLPVGRVNDLPWFNINRIDVTLSQAATLAAGDVSVVGVTGGDYGPVTVSGSGTSYVLTLAKPVAIADMVTLTIGNAQITTYTRRLDILPGDVDDNGAVNTTDGVLILNMTTPAHAYQIFDDMNGDGAVSTADFTLYRPKIGTVLPNTWPQLATGGEGPGGASLLTQAQVAPALSAAIQRWAAAGLPAKEVALLRSVQVAIIDLPAGALGETALGGTTIELSADAAGYGWYTSVGSAFGRPVAPTELVASASSPAAGHEDLVTVLTHELGHTLGLVDLTTPGAQADVMAQTLATGVRRLPSAHDVMQIDIAQGTLKTPLALAPALGLDSRIAATPVRPAPLVATSGKTTHAGPLGLRVPVKYRSLAATKRGRRV